MYNYDCAVLPYCLTLQMNVFTSSILTALVRLFQSLGAFLLSRNNYIQAISRNYFVRKTSGLTTRGFPWTNEHFVICGKGSSFHLTCLENNPLQNKQHGVKVCYLELGSFFLRTFQDRHTKLSNFPGTAELPNVVGWILFRFYLEKMSFCETVNFQQSRFFDI